MTKEQVEQKAIELYPGVGNCDIDRRLAYIVGVNTLLNSEEYKSMKEKAEKFDQLVQRFEELEGRDEEYPGQNSDDKMDIVMDIIGY